VTFDTETMIAEMIFFAVGGESSEIQKPGPALLGHPTTREVMLAPGTSAVPSLVWLHHDGPSYPLPDDGASNREDIQSAPFTGLLKPNHKRMIPLVYDTPVLTRRVNGRLEVYDTNGVAAAQYFDGVDTETPLTPIGIAQFDYGLLKPTNPASGALLLSSVGDQAVYDINGMAYYPPDLYTADLIAAYGSGMVAGQAVAVQIIFDPVTETFTYNASAAFTDSGYDAVTGLRNHQATFANYPRTIPATEFNVGWAVVRHGVSALYQADLLPAPDLLSKGGGSPGGILDTIVVADGDVVTAGGYVVYVS